MSFDGIDDYLFIPQNNISIMNNISSTVSFWFKMPNLVQHPYDMVFLTNHWQSLNPENILDAIDAVNPSAVDVNSGVESFPGKKDYNKLKSLFKNLNKTQSTGFQFG